MDRTGERHPRRWLILVVLCLSTLVLVVDNMVLTVALAPLAEDLGTSAQDTQWILDAYILVFAGLLLTSGGLGDRFGRRKIMLVGLTLFGAASLVATFAAGPVELIVARVVMGIGGALIMPSTLSILITVFDDTERRKAMSVWSAVAMIGLVGGPVLGGALIAWFWWGAVFLINVPIAGLAIIAALLLMPESKAPWRKADPLGAVLSFVGMTALVATIIELPRAGLGHPVTLTALAVAVLGLTGFVFWELRVAHPLVPLELFRNRDFSGGSFSLTLVQIGNGGLLLVLAQYLQFVLGYTSTQAGLAFIPMAVASLLANTAGATLGQRFGNRTLATTGLVIMAAAFGVLSTVSTGQGFATLAIGLFLLGIGGGLAMPSAISSLMSAVPADHAGVGSALNDTIQQMGAALGVAVLGSVLSSGFSSAMPGSAPESAKRSMADALAVPGLGDAARSAFTSAISTTFVVSACGVAAAAAVAFLVLRNRKTGSAEQLPHEPRTAEVAA
ncbi:MFS transporter [Amycolatopsis sp. NPDC058986]|uniref:MFS transporter n=1 Tax=unclassified Amycolatopsis TaxID=2618356 RepID=UPI003672B72D